MYTIEFKTRTNEYYEVYSTYDNTFMILWMLNENKDVIEIRVFKRGGIVAHTEFGMAKLSKMII